MRFHSIEQLSRESVLMPDAMGKETSVCPFGRGCGCVENCMPDPVSCPFLSLDLGSITRSPGSEEGKADSHRDCYTCYCQFACYLPLPGFTVAKLSC